MLFRMSRSGEEPQFTKLEKKSAAKLELKEKDIETWLASHRKLLFGTEDVFVIAQSVIRKRMPDLLALDRNGNLVVVEIKRDGADRNTAGQLLDYAADYSTWHYNALNNLYQRYRNEDDPENLLDGFRRLPGKDRAQEDDIPKKCRLCIVAPGLDDGLERIIRYLEQAGVRINFIPFALFSDEDGEIVLDIEQLEDDDENSAVEYVSKWQGDWMFNTNETHAQGAYEEMFDQHVVAIFGYPNGDRNLQKGAIAGQRVFAYVNGRGIVASGEVVDGRVIDGNSVFGKGGEFHMKVKWHTIIRKGLGVMNADVLKESGRNLPYRKVFCRLYSHNRPE